MILLMIFSSILIYKNLKKEPSAEKIFDLPKSTLIRVFALPVLVLIYTHILELFGYLISTTIGLAVNLFRPAGDQDDHPDQPGFSSPHLLVFRKGFEDHHAPRDLFLIGLGPTRAFSA